MLSTLLGRRPPVRDLRDSDLRPPEPRIFTRPPAPQKAADDRLYFAVRSYAATGFSQVLQYAFVDDRGNVVMSAMGRTPASRLEGEAPHADLAVDPFDAEALDRLLTHICKGANLVAFGRVLNTGLLPPAAAASAQTVECAWRRFLRLSRRRTIAFDRSQPLMIEDALAAANLPPLTSEDAALRALAVRDLWAWMDRLELEAG